MKPRHFLKRVEHDRVHQAIQSAEQGTCGRVVVYISHQAEQDGLEAAHRAFEKLNLENENEKAGFLLFLAPQTRKFAVVGGTALHEKLGQDWWEHLTKVVTHDFKEEHYTEGLVAVLTKVGLALKKHFPGERPRDGRRPEIIEE